MFLSCKIYTPVRRAFGLAATILFLALLPGFGAALAQQPAATSEYWAPLALPPGAETGKPRMTMPPLAPAAVPGCEAALPCRLRLIGEVPGNGGDVELRAKLFSW